MQIPRTAPAGVEKIAGYPIPAGGADTPPAGDGTTDGDTSGTGTTDDGQAGTETDGQDGDGSGTDGKPDHGRAGGEEALRADLARERKRRRDAERELTESRRTQESETEAREREIREQAQGPAIKALRVTAVEMAAREAGFLYPEDAFALLTADERTSVEVDLEAEIPTADRAEAAKLVKALAKRRPGLVKAAEPVADDGPPTSGKGGSDAQAGNGRTSSSSSDPNATLRGLFRQKLGA